MNLEQRINLFGYRFVFRTNYPRAADLISSLYDGHEDGEPEIPPDNRYELAQGGPEDGWIMTVPGLPPHPKPTFGEAIWSVEACIASDTAKHDSGLHAVHAAVVNSPAGAILLSGNSGAGKTTLSLGLGAFGLEVGGDDMALLDGATGLVRPLPRCFHVDERSVALLAVLGLKFPEDDLRDQFVTPHHLGLSEMASVRARFVFLLEPERLPAPRIVPESQADAASSLLMQTGRGHFTDRDGFVAVAQLAGGCRCYRLWSGGLAETAEAVLKTCGIDGSG